MSVLATLPFYSSRSALETLQRCPRERFWAYGFARGYDLRGDGTRHHGGIASKHKSIYQLTGIVVHAGLGRMLAQPQMPVDQALAEAIVESDYWRHAAAGLETHQNWGSHNGGSLDGPEPPELLRARLEWTAYEQLALAEAELRVWDLVCRPGLRERYVTLEAEKEGRLHYTSSDGREFVFEFRPDAVLEDQVDGSIYVYSLKTASQWGWEQQQRHARDMQGMSELLGWNRTGGAAAGRFATGVLMQFLLKGQRRQDDRVGWKVQQTPLVRGWFADAQGVTGTDRVWAWSWDTPKRDKNNQPYKGKLGGGYQPFYAWRDYPGGVKGWIGDLYAGVIQTDAVMEFGNPLLGIVITPDTFARRHEHMESWERQMLSQEAQIATGTTIVNGLIAARGILDIETQTALDQWFPQEGHGNGLCIRYGGICPMDALCHGTREMLGDPLNASGPYELRKPHHSEGEDD